MFNLIVFTETGNVNLVQLTFNAKPLGSSYKRIYSSCSLKINFNFDFSDIVRNVCGVCDPLQPDLLSLILIKFGTFWPYLGLTLKQFFFNEKK